MIDKRMARSRFRYDFNRHKSLYFFILPGLVILILFNYLPIYGVTIAFKNYNPLFGIMGSKWVGLKYFDKLFNSIFFWRIFKNTLIINFLQLIFGFPAPIILALLLNEVRNTAFKRSVQTVTYLPHFLSWVIAGGFVVTLLSPNQGVISFFSELFTGKKSDLYLMIQPQAFRWILVGSSIWKNVGWGSIIYIAAISGINPELYEAATMDGVNRFQKIVYITLPSIFSTIIVLFILRIGQIMATNFEQIFILYSPNVYSTGDVISTYVFREGLGKGQYSYTTAIGLFQSVIGFVLMIAANTLSKRLGQNSLW
jgi:putative aldouronate transport system permease protein